MDNYLTPSIAQAIPLIHSACEDLTKQELIHYISEITEEFTIGDPELADNLIEGKKSIPACLRYVKNEAAYVVEKQVMAMSDDEFNMLPERTIQGKNATMAGGVIGKEQVREWIDDYYYKTDILDPVGSKIEEEKEKCNEEAKVRKAETDAKKKKNKKGDVGGKSGLQSGKQNDSIQEKEVPSNESNQISLFSA